MTIIRAAVENLSTLQAVDAQTVERLAHAINLPAVGNEFTLDLAETFLRGAIVNLHQYGVVARVSDWHVHRGGHHVALIHVTADIFGEGSPRVLFVTEEPAEEREPRTCEQCDGSGFVGNTATRCGVCARFDRVNSFISAITIREDRLYAAAYADACDRDGVDAAAENLLVSGRTYGVPSHRRTAIRRGILSARLGPQVTTSDECPQCSRIGRGPLCAAHRPAEGDFAPEDGGQGLTPPVAAPEAAGATKAHADDAPTVAPAIAAGDDVDVFVNQATREGWVLAVLGDEYILEYTMPKGTTALQIRRVDGGSIKDGKWHGSYRSVSYTSLSRKWLQAIVDAGSVWEGKAQGVYKVWNDRFGSSGNSYHRVPSAADLLAKKAVR